MGKVTPKLSYRSVPHGTKGSPGFGVSVRGQEKVSSKEICEQLRYVVMLHLHTFVDEHKFGHRAWQLVV